jgi:hypothetical protein
MAIPILGMLIPILAIVLGLGMGMLSVYLDFRKKREIFQLHHAERMAAIEKGIELPPLPAELFTNARKPESGPARQRRIGLILLLLGIAIGVALWQTGDKDGWWGLVPAAIGLAYLISSALERAERAKSLANQADAPSKEP